MSNTTFASMGLSPETLQALEAMAFETPSPIQAEAIVPLMAGGDIIGQAQTGTGKTAAFAIPIIEKLDPQTRMVQAVVLCPTRELAIQVADSFRNLMQFRPNCRVVSIYGGQPIDKQLQALKKRPQILVGTPGRMLDHIRRGSFRLDEVKTVVLDEADEMLDMGFRDDIQRILDQTPDSRQTALFSATMPKAILELTHRYQRDPVRINVIPEVAPDAEDLIEQQYFEVSRRGKFRVLTGLITSHSLKRALVFCNTKRQVDDLADKLQEEGYTAAGLHGGMSQNQRDRVMGRFRNGTLHLLIATDVAARGIDVHNVQAVFNYDIPEDTEKYIHRIGRTGRAGLTGQAFTFIEAGQSQILRSLQRVMSTKLQLQTIDGSPVSDVFQERKPLVSPVGDARKKRPFFKKKKSTFPKRKVAQSS